MPGKQAGGKPKDQAGDRAKSHAQVVKLGVEIELLELEHEVARGELSNHKEIRMAESRSPEELQEMALGSMMLLREDREALSKLVEKHGEKGIVNVVDEAASRARPRKTSRDRKKKDYARQAEDLAGKRLELAEVEKRYNEAR